MESTLNVFLGSDRISVVDLLEDRRIDNAVGLKNTFQSNEDVSFKIRNGVSSIDW